MHPNNHKVHKKKYKSNKNTNNKINFFLDIESINYNKNYHQLNKNLIQ